MCCPPAIWGFAPRFAKLTDWPSCRCLLKWKRLRLGGALTARWRAGISGGAWIRQVRIHNLFCLPQVVVNLDGDRYNLFKDIQTSGYDNLRSEGDSDAHVESSFPRGCFDGWVYAVHHRLLR